MNREARFAIVGAGPAGMTLARKLASAGPVLLIEGGGLDADDQVQSLYEGECVGISYPLAESRARRFGGSSSLWAGYCAAFDAHDFRRRQWVPGSGWPFGPEALEPCYAEAAQILNLGEADFDAREIAARCGLELPFDEGVFVPSVWRFGVPTPQFGEHLRGEFEASERITTLLHANVADIRLDAGHGEVREVVIRTLNGREGRIAAEVVVLACGGIETPRILLNAGGQVPGGLGNSGGQVGRFFMEHPHFPVESIVLGEAGWFTASMDRMTYDEGRQYMLAVGLADEVQQALGILNGRAHVYRVGHGGRDVPQLGIMSEQAPNPDSRVTLSDRRDALGLRCARLDWRLAPLDWRTHEQMTRLLGGEMERIGAGRVRQRSRPRAGEAPVGYCNHHMGTTRMAEDAAAGVVDANCRVHGVRNLYIAGSGVFPTGSWANPTFTLIALTLRLAEHLRGGAAGA